MGNLEKGSTFKDGYRTLTVTGTYRDGSLLVRTISNERLKAFKKATVKANELLGDHSRLVAKLISIKDSGGSAYFQATTDLAESMKTELAEAGIQSFPVGLDNVVAQVFAEEHEGLKSTEDAFVGVMRTTPDGVRYRVKCPFPKTSLKWVRTARAALQEASRARTNNTHK
ncbi:MAG: hypothetical protein KA035_03105 [Candidatus Levybacteria bacterium]|nr:hypothetical protein [Candidatus Levybacteria bacterium]